MRYKNILKGKNAFRAFNKEGQKVKFELEPNEEVELGKQIDNPEGFGLKQLDEPNLKSNKSKVGD